MKQIILGFFLIFAFHSLMAQTPAFPGAEGGGMYITGGRGGQVLYVTSLADDGSVGTLRWAINQTGTRTILFKVSGLITLTSKLYIRNGDLTIAGQTAPGDGICIRSYEVFIDADNVIVRYLRFRLGNEILTNESDALGSRYRKNMIIDHCSMSWSIDECASFYSNENFTMQWCLIAESLNNAGHSKGAHGYGGIWGGKNASFHHNLIAHHLSRNPRFNGWKRDGLSYVNPLDEERLDFRNNVIYDWGDNSSYGGESAGKYNLVANYFKYGPGTKSSIKYKITQIDIDISPSLYPPGFGQYYIRDNYVYESTAVTQDNWSGVTLKSGVDNIACKATVPFQNVPISQHTAEIAFERVLSYSGASLSRDATDTRIVSETQNGTATYKGSVSGRSGIIDSQTDVGGWPVYGSTQAPSDSNSDGIPDGWLETNYAGKTATDLDANGYTYLEVYLNSLVKTITESQNAGAVTSGISSPKCKKTCKVSAVYYPLSKQIDVESEQNIRRILLSDLGGRTLRDLSCNEQKISFEVTDLLASIYILTAVTNDLNVSTLKIAI